MYHVLSQGRYEQYHLQSNTDISNDPCLCKQHICFRELSIPARRDVDLLGCNSDIVGDVDVFAGNEDVAERYGREKGRRNAVLTLRAFVFGAVRNERDEGKVKGK